MTAPALPQVTETNEDHCELCGGIDPEVVDSYTTCCNEPICEGPRGGTYIWVYGDPQTRAEHGTVEACCSAMISGVSVFTRRPW